MTGTDICRIIKTCGESGVKHFAFGDLEFMLGDEPVALTSNSMIKMAPIEKVLDYDVEPSHNGTDNDDGQQSMFEDEFDNLALSDPEAYEEVEMNGGSGV